MKPPKYVPRKWCPDCQAQKEPWHVHGDPLEQKTWEQLLDLARHPLHVVTTGLGAITYGGVPVVVCDELLNSEPMFIDGAVETPCLKCSHFKHECTCPPNEAPEP